MELMVSEIEVFYKTKKRSILKVTSSRHAVDIFKQHWDENTIEYREEVQALYLNKQNQILAINHHSSGTISGCTVDIKHLLVAVLKLNATGIIIAHNHPSGLARPSDADKKLTKKLKDACSYLDIDFLDHLIITSGDEYYSFSDEGML